VKLSLISYVHVTAMSVKSMKQIYLIYFAPILVFLLLAGQMYSSETYKRTVNISVRIDSSGAKKQFVLNWDNSDTLASGFHISRKLKFDDNWEFLASVDASVSTYSDTNESNSTAYEYQIIKTTSDSSYQGYGYIYSGHDLTLPFDRGIALLLIDNTMMTDIQDELYQYELDLIGDGYKVIKHYVERTEEFFSPAVSRTKSFIELVKTENPNTQLSIIIIGRVAVPYSGNTPWDGHNPDHAGAWASDLFYAVDRDYWSDNNVYNILPTRIENKNIPFDGKFDQSVINVNRNIIGRIDMYNLLDFKESETALIKRYFRKNHDFRTGITKVRKRALLDDGFNTYAIKEAPAANGWMNFCSLLGADAIDTVSYRYSMSDSNYLWSYGCNSGAYDNIYNTAYSSEMAIKEYKSVFTILLGSYAGDWDTQNNILRSAIASEPSILTAAWSGRPFWMFHHMALGEPIGYSTLISQNNHGLYETTGNIGYRGIQINLLGDPTLRMSYFPPPQNLSLVSDTVVSGTRQVELSWEKPDDEVIGYYIFRSEDISDRPLLIEENIITEEKYIDRTAPDGGLFYMVRAVKRELSVSGSYYNLSQGKIIEIVKPMSVSQEINSLSFKIYPNPTSDNAHLMFYLDEPQYLTYSIYDTKGILIHTSGNYWFSKGNHSISLNIKNAENGLSQGLYFVQIITKNRIVLGKLIIID